MPQESANIKYLYLGNINTGNRKKVSHEICISARKGKSIDAEL